LHEAGVVHKDPHLGNILYRSGTQKEPFVILDTDQVTLQGDPLEESARLRNLALFPSLKYSPSRTEVLRFLKGYRALSGPAGTSFRQKYAKSLFEHSSKLYRKHAGRSLATNSRFCKESVGGFQVYRQATDETASILLELMPDPDLLLEQGEIYKDGRTVRAAKVTIGGKSYFLKRFNTKSFWYRFRNAFRSSRAVRAWLNNWEFKYRNLPVPEPLLCIEERRCRLLGRSYLLTEFFEGSEKLKTRWQEYSDEQQETMLIRIAVLLARMHRLGCVHGDLKWANVLVKGDTPYLIDLDGSRVLKRWNTAVFRKDIKRFLVDIDKYSRQDFRLLFLKCWEKHLY
jgi:tRNA A-37 threonylcarbamoyl transferase component Bud32